MQEAGSVARISGAQISLSLLSRALFTALQADLSLAGGNLSRAAAVGPGLSWGLRLSWVSGGISLLTLRVDAEGRLLGTYNSCMALQLSYHHTAQRMYLYTHIDPI